MSALKEIIAGLCLASGTFFFAAGTVGILRMPDAYTRMHVAAKSDTLGAGLWLVGLAVVAGEGVTSLKLVLLLAFIWLTSPTAAHCMARAARRTGVPPVRGTESLRDPRLGEACEADRPPGRGADGQAPAGG